MIKVLFVCHGNICRSPMAEFIFKDMVKKKGIENQFKIASAATSSEEIWKGVGNPVYPPARGELAKHRIGCEGKRAVQLKASDYEYYDYLICMDKRNVKNAERITGHKKGDKISLMLEYAGYAGRECQDPWYSNAFDVTYEEIVMGCKAFLEFLQKEGKI